jgi:hypothetical protein
MDSKSILDSIEVYRISCLRKNANGPLDLKTDGFCCLGYNVSLNTARFLPFIDHGNDGR